ncbi:zinc-binding alcohol dehydrogenase family protein [Kushneria phosphatilytica]|uniref:Zinc-binding alcohol dehydrogenase family protein n=1 Tax=Kushneria phosphatilytica TaxID=657387 RepID=A0A1S1NS08_9GAMM|nr:zinc-binding alcohol dehydrogenase family protein [Kushneria phosphatilytica]OHV08025.1 alcohol dehydrogenase [Kushneria phosphatilytica]QEL09937.1 zinc-binding alcohol dehydrogenase family protein [Kushneria phosphatilytica]
MRVLECTTPGSMTLVERERPEPGPGEVLLDMRRVGICGTDIHAFGGNQPYFSYPRVLGHELAGRIVATGSTADRGLIGHDACIIPYLHCGQCAACRRGRTNCCQSLEVIGVHRDGGMAEALVVPTRHLMTSEILSVDQLALVECLAIGAHAVRRSELSAGELAVVVGAGPIGMGVIQFARSCGARVMVIDTNRERLAFCIEELGVEETCHATEDDVMAALEALSEGALGDVVFDATGNPAAMNRGFDFAGHGGRYVLVSVVRADITFHDPDFHRRELTLLGSRNATYEDFATVMTAMEAGRLHEQAMITHRCTLADMPDTMARWCAPASGVIKGMIEIDAAARSGAGVSA